MELDDFLYTSAGRGRYACFTGTNRLMFITHRTNKYTELDEVKMVTKGGCTWVQLRMKENLNLEVAKAIAHFTLVDGLRLLSGRRSGNGFQSRYSLCPFR